MLFLHVLNENFHLLSLLYCMIFHVITTCGSKYSVTSRKVRTHGGRWPLQSNTQAWGKAVKGSSLCWISWNLQLLQFPISPLAKAKISPLVFPLEEVSLRNLGSQFLMNFLWKRHPFHVVKIQVDRPFHGETEFVWRMMLPAASHIYTTKHPRQSA